MIPEDPQLRARMVSLRKIGASLEVISSKTGINTSYVREILKEELKDSYDEYKLKNKSKRVFTKQERNKIVELRKSFFTLQEISHVMGSYPVQIATVLREELKDLYEEYKIVSPSRVLTEQEKREIVELRKDFCSLNKIARIFNTGVQHVVKVLKEELGSEYRSYCLRNQYRNYLNGSDEEVATIQKLWKKGKSLTEIKGEVGVSKGFIKHVLIEAGEETLKPEKTKQRTKENKTQLRYQLTIWYTKFLRTLPNYSLMVADLKDDAVNTFFEVKATVTKKFKISIPVFIFVFLRAHGVNISLTHLQKLSGLTRHDCFKTIKRITDNFPQYLFRNRKKVVLTKIKEVPEHLELDGELGEMFYRNSRNILNTFRDLLQATTDNVIAGTVAVLTHLSLDCKTTISSVCTVIGITQSAVISQISKLLSRLGIEDFATLVQSRDLIINEVLTMVKGIQM